MKIAEDWIEDKRNVDGAEGLWRVYDKLYDVTDFINRHPGGKFWLETTKGTDITELFESYHISTSAEAILRKFYVRAAILPRHSPFTFEENGFYKTLKRNVRETLKTIPKKTENETKLLIDALFLVSFIFAIMGLRLWNFKLAILSGVCFGTLGIAAHNFYHLKDNFRMYFSDIAFISSRDMRIIHVLSHHMYSNSSIDLQAYFSQPLINIFPQPKSKIHKYGSWFYVPLFLWPTTSHFLFITRALKQGFYKTDLFYLTLPLIMYAFGQCLTQTLGMWFFITLISSFSSFIFGFTGSHYHPKLFVDGDSPRAQNDKDWGISQLDATADRIEITGNQFLSLVTFGDHSLHHLFPGLDHAVLKHLYLVTEETMKDFNLNFNLTTQRDMLGGYFKRIFSEKPNAKNPNLEMGKGLSVQKILNSKNLIRFKTVLVISCLALFCYLFTIMDF